MNGGRHLYARWLSKKGYPGYSEKFAKQVSELVMLGYSIHLAITLAYDD